MPIDERRAHDASEAERDQGGGALTGATGSLTPDTSDEAFVPAETREIELPPGAADVTTAMREASDVQDELPPPGAALEEPAAESAVRSPDEDRF